MSEGPREDPAPGSDRQIIAAYLEGTAAAFREVDGWIRTELAVRFPVLRSDAADLSQSIHEQLLEALRAGSFRHRSALKTYVVRITRYNAVDWLRRTRRDRMLEENSGIERAAPGGGPYRDLVARELAETLLNIVMLAPRTCRQLWELAFVEGLGFREIAARLGIPQGTVKSRMWYCRHRALTLLERLRGGGRSNARRPR
jgi:RNA polymerase sigma-70 factor (ECF subfamily)